MRTLSLRHFLALRGARLAAVCLLLLIASPFTAPFSTCDLSIALSHTGLGDGSTESLSDKIATDTALPVFEWAASPLVVNTRAVVAVPALTTAVTSQTSPVPLRL